MFIISEDGTNVIPSEKIEHLKIATSSGPKPYVTNEDGTKMYADTSDQRPVEYLITYALLAYTEPKVPLTEPVPIHLFESTHKTEVEAVLLDLLNALASSHVPLVSPMFVAKPAYYRICRKVITKDLREEVLAVSILNKNVDFDNATNLDVLRKGTKLQIAKILLDSCDKFKWQDAAQIMDWINAKISK